MKASQLKSTSELTIRAYRFGDEAQIRALFQRAFDQPMSGGLWQWRFGQNPTGRVLIDLMMDGPNMAGHYAVSPVVTHVEDADVMTGLSMTTMTDPAYQGRGIFRDLANSLYSRMAADGFAMVWGFPNEQSHRGFRRDLGWTDIWEIPTFRVETRGASVPPRHQNIRHLPSFDGGVDALWSRIEPAVCVVNRRDQRYLNWRFGPNSPHDYQILGWMEDAILRGYAVCKPYAADLDLVDLLAEGDDVGLALIAAVVDEARIQQRIAVNCWMNPSWPLHLAAERIGFRNAGPVTYFGAKPLATSLSDAVLDYRSWYVTMGDSDVY